jgi:hypothetical protein
MFTRRTVELNLRKLSAFDVGPIRSSESSGVCPFRRNEVLCFRCNLKELEVGFIHFQICFVASQTNDKFTGSAGYSCLFFLYTIALHVK